MADGSPENGRTASLPWAGGYEIVDLSVLVAEDMPCYWPTHQPYQAKVWNWYENRQDVASAPLYSREGPYATRWLALDEHTGTHFDAPSHFIPQADSGLPYAGEWGAVSADRVPLSQLNGPAAVVDVSALTGSAGEAAVSPLVTVDHITAWEDAHGELTAGDVVLFRSGWDSRYRRGPAGQAYAHDVIVTGRGDAWPAPDVATIELLLDRGVRCTGIDAPSIAPVQGKLPVEVHVTGLGAGAVFVEGLAGLDALPPRGAWFCFLPVKLEGATGAPGRAVAWVPRAG
ncbi:cyclase family protein [Streptomyces sp. NPDC002536]